MHAELDSRWADAAQAEAAKFALVISRLEAELAATRCACALRRGAARMVCVIGLPLLPCVLSHASLCVRSAALEREVAARTEAEERFKQAFMRGVCALNFEALTVLKGSAAATAGSAEGRAAPSPMRHM
jgi:hypothetical protein